MRAIRTCNVLLLSIISVVVYNTSCMNGPDYSISKTSKNIPDETKPSSPPPPCELAKHFQRIFSIKNKLPSLTESSESKGSKDSKKSEGSKDSKKSA